MQLLSTETSYKISHLVFLLMLVLSVFYAVERVCYMDSAFMLFRMVNSSAMIAEGGRWINLLPQFIPWLAIRLQLPLGAVIVLFSVCQILALFLFFILVGNYFKQKTTAVIFTLLLLLSVSETFFDAVTETKFSLACGVLFAAFLNSEKRTHFLTGSFIIFCGFFSHPAFIIYYIFTLLFFAVFKSDKKVLQFLIPGLLIFSLKYALIGSTPYENNLVAEALVNAGDTFKNSFIHTYFYGLLKTPFLILVLLFFVLFLYLFYQRMFLQLLVYLTVLFFTYFLLALIYSKGDSHMMIQKTMFVFHFIILLPYIFIWNELPKKVAGIAMILILSGFISGLSDILSTSAKYSHRVDILTDFMKKNSSESDKFIIRENAINHDIMMGTWALSHETILISNKEFHKSIIIKNFRDRNDTLFYSRYPCAFRPAFGYPMMNRELNAHYFRINEQQPSLWLDSTVTLP